MFRRLAVTGFFFGVAATQSAGAQNASAQSQGGAVRDSGWYFAVGGGANRTGVLKQAGFNRDDICYPTNVCPRQPDGYRWFYDLDPGSGAVFDLAVGRSLNTLRLEVSASSISGSIQESFTGITYFDGTPVMPAEDSDYANRAETAVDGLTTRTLGLNVYRDFPRAGSRLTPYLGIGVGVSSVELAGLYFRSEYSCVREPCTGRPAAEFNSHQNADLTDTVWSGLVQAGVDYNLEDSRYVLGLNVSYRTPGDLEAEAGYVDHPFPDERNFTMISDMDHWSLTVRIKFRLGARDGT